jgi:hypothetical protein
MAEKITARDAEKIVVQLKSDFNSIAGQALKLSHTLEAMKDEEATGREQARVCTSDAGARLEQLRLRMEQVSWNHEVVLAQQATHEHLIARIQRVTIESAAQVDTLRLEVVAATRAGDTELLRAQGARDSHALANEQLAAKQQECEVVRGGFEAELESMEKHSVDELEVYAYHNERIGRRGEMEKRIRNAPSRRSKYKATGKCGHTTASEAITMDEAFSNLSRLTNAHDIEDLVEIFVGQDAKRSVTLRKTSELEALSKQLRSSVRELQIEAMDARMVSGGKDSVDDAQHTVLSRDVFNSAASAADASDRKSRTAAENYSFKSKLAGKVVTAIENLSERLGDSGGRGTGVQTSVMSVMGRSSGSRGRPSVSSGRPSVSSGRPNVSSGIDGETSDASESGLVKGGTGAHERARSGRERMSALEATIDVIVARVTAAGIDVMQGKGGEGGVMKNRKSRIWAVVARAKTWRGRDSRHSVGDVVFAAERKQLLGGVRENKSSLSRANSVRGRLSLVGSPSVATVSLVTGSHSTKGSLSLKGPSTPTPRVSHAESPRQQSLHTESYRTPATVPKHNVRVGGTTVGGARDDDEDDTDRGVEAARSGC